MLHASLRLACLQAVLVASAAASDFTHGVTPDFRTWDSAAYAGWSDWSGISANGRNVQPDDPASTAASAVIKPATLGPFTFNASGDLCMPTTGDRFALDYRDTSQGPVTEVIVQIKAETVQSSIIFLLYNSLGGVNILRPTETIDLASDERLYRFLLAPIGQSPGTLTPVNRFSLETIIPPVGGESCVGGVLLDVRHRLEGAFQPTCGNAASGVANSLSVIAGCDAGGSSEAAQNLFALTASGIPVGSFGYFLASETLSSVPCAGGCLGSAGSSVGALCLSGAVAKLAPVHRADVTQAFRTTLDLNQIPSPAAPSVIAGSTWHFQAWYRDAVPQVTTNFTRSVGVLFR